jgi:hypothetical protein
MSFIDKLAKIEALIERASSEGEKQAAQLAKERILNKICIDQSNKPIEYRVSHSSPWEKRLFIALCRKLGFQTEVVSVDWTELRQILVMKAALNF